MNDQEQKLDELVQNEATNAEPDMNAAPSGNTTRLPPRRRIARYADEPQEETPAPQPETAPEKQEAKPAAEDPELPRLQPGKVTRQAPMTAATRRDIPVPAALRNATRQETVRRRAPQEQNRRPVDEPGYMRRVPLGQTGPEIEAARDAVPVRSAMPVRQPMERPPMVSRTVGRPADLNSYRRPEDQDAEGGAQPVQRASAPVSRTYTPRNESPADEEDYENYDGPVFDDEDYEPDDEPRPHRVWLGMLCVVLLLAAAVIGLLLIPEDDTGMLGFVRRTVVSALPGSPASVPKITNMEALPTTGTAPASVTVNITAETGAKDIRLVDGNGNVLETETLGQGTGSASSWVLRLEVDTAFTGMVYAQAFDGQNWHTADTAQGVQLAFTEEASVQPTIAPADEEQAPDEDLIEDEELVEEDELIEDDEESVTPTPEATARVLMLIQPSVTEAPGDLTGTDLVSDPAEKPTPAPTAAPTATPTAEPTAEPTPEPTATPRMTAGNTASSDPKLIGDATIYGNTGKAVAAYDREASLIINMPAEEAYAYKSNDYGVLTGRGDAFRRNAAGGAVGSTLTGLRLKWKAQMGSIKSFDGKITYAGMAGNQPVIIKWSATVRELSDIKEEKKYTRGLTEVIVAGNDGKIYFLDLEDGQATRDVIDLGYPMRATPSLHPYFYPLMTVGQYARKVSSGTGKIGVRYYNLLTRKQMSLLDGLDGELDRPYNQIGSFETSALYDPASDSMVTIGTNGMLTVADLGTSFDYNAGTISISPDYVYLTSRTSKKQKDAGVAVEAEFAMYQSYVWYADIEGNLRCVDTTSLTTQWAVATGDMVESAVALDLEGGKLGLYTATELGTRTKGNAQIRRYNAMDGSECWTLEIPVAKNKKNNNQIAGVKASPVIGEKNLSDIVYYTVSNVSADGAKQLNLGTKAVEAALLAINKETGKVMWVKALDSYTESSPVAVYNEAGKGWIIQCLYDGTVLLLEGRSGKQIATMKVNGKISASPAVYNDTLVIGTTGTRSTSFIYGISLLDEENSSVSEGEELLTE